MIKVINSFVLLLLLLGVSNLVTGFAQDNSSWYPLQRVPGYADDTWTPILIADPNRTVHAFSSQLLNEDQGSPVRAIMYSQWTIEQGWTMPVDILLSPLKNNARIMDAYLDQSGRIHVIFFGGDNTEANVYYSSAEITKAENVRAWSKPLLAAKNAQDPENASFYIDDQGNYTILFSGNLEGSGLYVTKSSDLGNTWSKPIQIFNTSIRANVISDLNIFESNTGRIHAIWNEITPEGQGRRIYYSHLEDGDSDWSKPILLAEAESGYGTNTPTVIEHAGNIIALYNMTPKIVMRLSTDGGLSWGNPVLIFPRHIGVSGNLSLVIDGDDTLHLFFVQRIPGITIGPGKPDIGGIWHSTWDNGRWIEPQSIAIEPDNKSVKEFAPYEPRAVISSDNTILVTWMTDPGLPGNGIWYSFTNSNMQNKTPDYIPTSQSSTSSISTSSPTQPSKTEEAKGTETIAQTEYSNVSSPSNIITSNTNPYSFFAFGLIPAILFIAVAVFIKSFLTSRR